MCKNNIWYLMIPASSKIIWKIYAFWAVFRGFSPNQRHCTTFGIFHFVPFEAKTSQNTWEISVNTCLSTQMRSSSEHKKSEFAKSTQKLLWVKNTLLLIYCIHLYTIIHEHSLYICVCVWVLNLCGNQCSTLFDKLLKHEDMKTSWVHACRRQQEIISSCFSMF